MDNMQEENDDLIDRINQFDEFTLNRLHRTLNSIARTVRQQDLSMDAYNRVKTQYETQIDNMSQQAHDLINDETSDLTTRTDRIRQLEQEALNLEENIHQIPESIQNYQPEEEPEPEEGENEEQMGGRSRRKTKRHRKSKHKGGKRKTKHNRKKTRRNKH